MERPQRFDPQRQTVGLDRDLGATVLDQRPGPPISVDGVTVGMATMTESAPHGGEMHPDGDEVLILVSGRARVVIETDPVEQITMAPGDGVVVPRGVWHKVDILEPSQVVYVTPGPENPHRPLPT